MLKDKGTLVLEIERQYNNLENSMGKRRLTLFLRETCRKIKEKHNIPLGTSMEVITGSKDRIGYSDFILFSVTEQLSPETLKEYFTKREITKYKEEKIKEENIKTPLSLPAVKVNNDQWLSAVSVRELMRWRDAQFIIYNTNTQRVLEKKISGDTEYYSISINKAAVANIKESLLAGTYIPDTLTFNIPPENGEIIFDEGRSVLTIDPIKGMDIIDGYHRYLAISQIYDNNKQLGGKIEIRITSFSESKAKQFIWQQDQKTKMKKTVSDSFNQYNNGNIVAQRLNEDPMCDFQVQINLSTGVLYAPDFSRLVDKLWFSSKENADRSYLFETIKELKGKLNSVYEEHISLFSSKVPTKILILLLFSCRYSDVPAKTFDHLVKETENADENLFTLPLKIKIQKYITELIENEKR